MRQGNWATNDGDRDEPLPEEGTDALSPSASQTHSPEAGQPSQANPVVSPFIH